MIQLVPGDILESAPEGSAIFSPDHRYRYVLKRNFASAGPTCTFIMLNPSTADHTKNDATIHKCIAYAKRWGCRRLIVLNLFAFRSRDPKSLISPFLDPVGVNNNHYLQTILTDLERAEEYKGPVIAAWSSEKIAQPRATALKDTWPVQLSALKINKKGSPAHPLYLPTNSTPIPYAPV